MSQRSFDRQTRRREQNEARRHSLRRRRAGLTAGAVGAAVLLSPAAANAAEFQVTNNADAGADSLRDAVTQSNANGNGEADTITFAGSVTGTINLTSGQLPLDTDVTITGPGASQLTIAGDSSSRIFDVAATSEARISGLTLTAGDGTEGGPPVPPPGDGTRSGSDRVFGPDDEGGGGAIRSEGDLTLVDSVVTGNVSSPSSADYGAGGGILITGGQATVQGTTVSDNEAQGEFASGGGIANIGGTLAVRTSVITENTTDADDASFGGGITAIGTTTVSDGSRVEKNSAQTGGGIAGNDAAVFKYNWSDFDRSSRQVQIPSQLTVSDSTIVRNDAVTGGGIATQFGQGAESGGPGKTFVFDSTDNVTVVRSTVDNNTATSEGGGMYVGNQSEDNAVTVRETTLSNNRVENEVPTRQTRAPIPTGFGGGIRVDRTEGPFLVSNSTVSGNSAAHGGGVFAGNASRNGDGRLTRAQEDRLEELPAATRSEVLEELGNDGDQAESSQTSEPRGSTTGEQPPPDPTTGSLTIANTTVASNSASSTGGGIEVGTEATDARNTELNSTIAGNNTAGGAANDLATPAPVQDDREVASPRGVPSPTYGFDVAYSLVEAQGSAVANYDPGKPSVTGQDPALGGLTGNGGPTQTHLPAGTSPAIDKGTRNGLGGDQRGLARTVQGPPANASDGTDIGAVEIPFGSTAQQPASSPVTPSSTPAVCGRRAISLVRADRRGRKIKLTGLVGAALYGKTVTIQTDPKGAKASAFTKTATVKASKTGKFTAMVPKPAKEDYVTVRYRAKSGRSTSPQLKLPQSLTSRSVKSAKGTITVKGRVRLAVLGKRNRVAIRRLVCGRYRTVGRAKPDAKGNYSVTFRATTIRGAALYRAESFVLRKPGSKVYVIQYARAISIRTTPQTG